MNKEDYKQLTKEELIQKLVNLENKFEELNRKYRAINSRYIKLR